MIIYDDMNYVLEFNGNFKEKIEGIQIIEDIKSNQFYIYVKKIINGKIIDRTFVYKNNIKIFFRKYKVLKNKSKCDFLEKIKKEVHSLNMSIEQFYKKYYEEFIIFFIDFKEFKKIYNRFKR